MEGKRYCIHIEFRGTISKLINLIIGHSFSNITGCDMDDVISYLGQIVKTSEESGYTLHTIDNYTYKYSSWWPNVRASLIAKGKYSFDMRRNQEDKIDITIKELI